MLLVLLLAACEGGADKPSDSELVDSEPSESAPGDSPGCTEEVEACDGIDNDCDGEVDEGTTSVFYADADGDGYGDEGVTADACEATTGWAAASGDCDDDADQIYPGATEACDGIDNDCDGDTDEDLYIATYVDADGDGYGDDSTVETTCSGEDGRVSVGGDCDDTDAEATPAAPGSCSFLSCDVATLFVSADGGAGYFTSIQDAIDAAVDGDVICVSPASYRENIDFDGKDIAVIAEGGPTDTEINGNDDASHTVTFSSGESALAQLQGFTIRGDEDQSGTFYVSGASPTLLELDVGDFDDTSTLFQLNSSYSVIYDLTVSGTIDNAMSIFGGAPTITRLSIPLDDSGAGLSVSNAAGSLSEVTITDPFGYAIYLDNASTALHDVEIVGGSPDRELGGVLSLVDSTSMVNGLLLHGWPGSSGPMGLLGSGITIRGGSPTLSDLSVSDCLAAKALGTPEEGVAAGLYATDTTLTLYNAIFIGNQADVAGGAMLLDSTTASLSNVIVMNNSSGLDGYDGYGAGLVATDSAVTLVNSLFAENTSNPDGTGTLASHGIYTDGTTTLEIVNTILQDEGLVLGGTSYAITYSSFSGVDIYETGGSGTGAVGSDGNISCSIDLSGLVVETAEGTWGIGVAPTEECLVDAGEPAILDVDGSVSDVGPFGGPNGEWD